MMRALLSLASHFYLFTAILYVAYFIRANRRVAQAALATLWVGFALHVAGLVHRYLAWGLTPFTNLAEGLSLLGLLLVAFFFVLERRYRLPVIGVFVMPIVVGVVLPAVLLRPEASQPLPEALKLAGMPLHVIVAFAGIAAFAVATGVAVAYLLLERQMKSKHFGVLFARLPSLELLDEISNRLMRWGFVALSITLLTGAVFAKKAWGDYWKWDPKLVLSLVAWLIYAALVHARMFAGWRGRRAAVLTMVGFAILFGSFLGLKIFPSGVHGGSFEPPGLRAPGVNAGGLE